MFTSAFGSPISSARSLPSVLALPLALWAGAAGWAQVAAPGSSTPLLVPSFTAQVTAPYAYSPGAIHYGTPITFSGRLLPVDATGTISFLVDGQPVQTLPVISQLPGDYVAFGDSVTAAVYIGDPSHRYQAILANTLNLSLTTQAVIGYSACRGLAQLVLPGGYGASTTTNPMFSFEFGSNDSTLYGIGAGEETFNLCHQAGLSWLALSRANKILIGDPGVAVSSGAWVNSGPNALTNTAGSGTVRFTLPTSGAAAYLWYLTQSSPGNFSVRVDGGPSSAAVSTLFNPGQDAISGSYALLRIPVAAGVHTFDVSAGGGTVSLYGMGSAPASGSPGPTVLVPDIGNTNYPGANPGQIVFNQDIVANIATLAADGLDLRFVPTRNYMFATPPEMFDLRHPSPLGLAEIAQAYLSVLPATRPPIAALPVAAATYTTSGVALGAHAISLVYSGDSKYAPTTAYAPFAVVTYDASSSVTLDTGGTVSPAGAPVTLTGTVGQLNAVGYVTFFDTTGPAPVALGTVAMPANVATLTLPSLPIGTHQFAAQYLGDDLYNPSMSAAASVTVSINATSTALSTPATRYFAASPVPLIAAVVPSSTAGTVTFFDGSTLLGQAVLVNGTASLTTAALQPGIHALTAGYSGDSISTPSVSPVLSVEIDLNSTVTALLGVPGAAPYGTTVAPLVTVAPNAATGSVTLKDSFVAAGQSGVVAQTLGQMPLGTGPLSWTLPNLAPGTHTLLAVYSGDADDLTSASAPARLLVTQDTTAISLAAVPASIVYGTPLTLAASVSPNTATGTVTFTDSLAGSLGQMPLANGSASLSTSKLAPGLHSISASYSGDEDRAGSVSAAVVTTITVVPSTIALGKLPPNTLPGTALIFAATIAPAAATGSVTFRDATFGVLGQANVVQGMATLLLPSPALGSYSTIAAYSGDRVTGASVSAAVTTLIALTPSTTALTTSAAFAPVVTPVTLTATVIPASATGSVTFRDGTAPLGTALLAAGKASLTSSALSVGVHSLSATYSGDVTDAVSTSASISQTIGSSTTSTALSLAQNPLQAGGAASVNVVVSSANTIPGGVVTLRSGTVTLASGLLANAVTGTGFATLSFNSSALGVGTFPLTAFYAGDADDTASNSSASPLPLTISAIPTSTALTLSAAQIPVQGVATLQASVSPQPGGGAVTFFANGAPLATVPLNAQGVASYLLTSNAIGTAMLTATYAATGFYASSSSAPLTLTTTAPLNATVSPGALQMTAASSQNATLTLTPLYGFTGTVQTSCQTSASFVTCSLSGSASINSAAPVAMPVLVTIPQNTAALLPKNAAAVAALALLLPLSVPRRHRRACVLLLAFFGASLLSTGCAEGGNFTSIPAGPQSVTIHITAAGTSFSTSLPVNLLD